MKNDPITLKTQLGEVLLGMLKDGSMLSSVKAEFQLQGDDGNPVEGEQVTFLAVFAVNGMAADVEEALAEVRERVTGPIVAFRTDADGNLLPFGQKEDA